MSLIGLSSYFKEQMKERSNPAEGSYDFRGSWLIAYTTMVKDGSDFRHAIGATRKDAFNRMVRMSDIPALCERQEGITYMAGEIRGPERDIFPSSVLACELEDIYADRVRTH